ncbi:MAG: DUF4252 domain-containing protein [Rikenellaceae bacterium]|nr:DUF4252 domain-containing protein [Rikenellaceae bacterium]
MNKSLIIILSLVLFPFSISAQTKQLDKIFATYENYKNVESVSITPELFATLSAEAKSNELLTKISLLKILNVSKGGAEKEKSVWINLRTDINKLILDYNFSQVLKVKEKGDILEMYLKKGENSLLVFMADSPTEYAVFYLQGNIDKSVIDALITGEIKIK